jgi:L-2-hydroxyglutarate oxidase LhgO
VNNENEEMHYSSHSSEWFLSASAIILSICIESLSMDYVETCVVGGGVVGLAIGARLAARSGNLLILEAEPRFGQGISSRNSEVIHAGIYYPANSLKAELCRKGKQALYQYCATNAIPHRKIGKIIVAVDTDDEDDLWAIQQRALENGVDDLVPWSRQKIAEAEPRVSARMALHSPSTGIVSCHDLMSTYLAEAESLGATFAPQCRVISVSHVGSKFVLDLVAGTTDKYQIACRQFVNSAGLGAQAIATSIRERDINSVPRLHLCKGNYFALQGASPFNQLIYPVPEKSGAGLGVHATLDMGGQLRFGPDVEYVDEEDYAVSLSRLPDYYQAIRRYYPDLADDSLVPDYAGIRPKIQAPDESARDFEIFGQADHGIENMVELFGIESPGLTASAAIADYVDGLLRC